MNKLLIPTVIILCFSRMAFADSVPIQDQTTLPCDNSSSIDCGKSITTNNPDPSAGQDDAGTNRARQLKSVTPQNETTTPNTTVTPVPMPNTPPPINAVPPLNSPAKP